MKTYSNEELGICPRCGSDNLDFDGFTVDIDGGELSVAYSATCDDCKLSFTENYNAEFCGNVGESNEI